MYRIDSALVQKDRLLPGIHGLRGAAALAVVFFHLVHVGQIAPPTALGFIGRDFGYSVHLFFILSAFSLMYSTEPALGRPGWLQSYLIKRFFRIAPLFYCMIAFESGRRVLFGGAAPDAVTLLLNLSFAFGAVPFSGIVWGGWSVGVEMIFYAVFPVLLLALRNPRAALLFLLGSLIVSHAIRAGLHAQHLALVPRPKWDWSYFAFGSNLCFFAMGIYAYHLSRRLAADSGWLRGFAWLAVTLLCALMFFDLGKHFHAGRVDILLWGTGLSALCLWQSLKPGFVLASPVFEYLGERSFSIYLLHPVVITAAKNPLTALHAQFQATMGAWAFLVSAAAATVMVLAAAEITYRLIEVPGIRLGRRLAAPGRAAAAQD